LQGVLDRLCAVRTSGSRAKENVVTRNRRAIAAVALGGIALAAALGGCSGQPARGTSAPPTAGSARPVTAAEASLLYQAQQVLLRDCLRRHGFSWTITPQHPVAEERQFPYAVDDIAWARAHGYGSDVAATIEQVRTSDPNRRYTESLAPDRRAAQAVAMYGAKSGSLTAELPGGMVVRRRDQGCQADAERALYGDLATWYRAERVTETLPSVRQQGVLDDPRYAAAVKPWAACMAKAGRAYPDPAHAHEARFTGPHARDEEIATAVAEATCARSTGFVTAVQALDHDHERTVTARYRAAVTTTARLQRAALPRARDLVAHSSR
jgi:hypothetical protein